MPEAHVPAPGFNPATWRRFGAAALAALLSAGALVGGHRGEVPVAHAQQQPEIALRADADEVELSDPISVTLTAMSDASTPQPSDPQIKVPAGWVVTGPMLSSQTQMSIINGQTTRRSGFRATWQVVPTSTGKFELGPVSFSLNGKRTSAGSLKVTVKPAGSGVKPRRQQRRSDPFGGLLGPLFGMGDDEPPRAPEPPPATGHLSLDAPIEPLAFMRAVPDKTKAVIGEQVTVTVYLYTSPRSYQLVDPHEPPAVDFFQRILSNGDGDTHPVNVGGARWMVQMIRKVALFPLKAGELTVGPMTVTLLGNGLRGGGLRGGLVRASQPLTISVAEPPPLPRPKGYVLGDVGSFSLQAQVEPRRVEVGGSISVTAVLRGVGNPPGALRLPERKGVTWLEPEVRESVDTSNNVVSGSKTFTFIVKLSEAGKIDLGELALPYWNPKLTEYQLARAPLGVVEVSQGAAPAASASAAPDVVDPFAAVGPARKVPGAFTPPGPMLSDAPWFWAIVAGGPAGVLLVQGSLGAALALRRARREREESFATRIKKAMSEARAADQARDGRACAAAVERALVLAVEEATGLKIRAMLLGELQPRLAEAGLAAPLPGQIVEALQACEAQRFLPGDAPQPESLIDRVAPLLKALSRGKP